MRNFLRTVGSNRILMDKKLHMDFPKPYDLLWDLPPEARAESEGKGAENGKNENWWTQEDMNPSITSSCL